jgi:Methionine biosynthesis protein MetW
VSESNIDLERVKREIDEEVRRQREGGTFDLAKEQELERAFLLFAPREGHGGAITSTLRGVDAAIYIDPVAPIESNQPAGRVVKQTLRKTTFWYFNWIAEQVTRALSTVAVALHLIEDELENVNERLNLVTIDATPIVEGPEGTSLDSWWVPQVLDAFEGSRGRVLVAACGDGWLVRRLLKHGSDAYGIDSRPGQIQRAQLHGADLRTDDLLDHLSHVVERRLQGVVLTGTTEGIYVTQRSLLLDRLDAVLASDGVLVVHAIHPDWLQGDAMPPALDFVGATPMRPQTWVEVLERRGYETSVDRGPGGSDFLVVARRPGLLTRS